VFDTCAIIDAVEIAAKQRVFPFAVPAAPSDQRPSKVCIPVTVNNELNNLRTKFKDGKYSRAHSLLLDLVNPARMSYCEDVFVQCQESNIANLFTLPKHAKTRSQDNNDFYDSLIRKAAMDLADDQDNKYYVIFVTSDATSAGIMRGQEYYKEKMFVVSYAEYANLVRNWDNECNDCSIPENIEKMKMKAKRR